LACRGRAAAPRPRLVTSNRLDRKWPWPDPRPCHSLPVTPRHTSAPSQGQAATRTAPRSRARTARRRTCELRTGPGGRTTTTSRASSRAATTEGQLSPGSLTRARRSRVTPSSATATRPSDGSPTAAHQDPVAEGAAARASASEVDPTTATVEPRRRTPPGSSPWRAGRTGRTCSPASETGLVTSPRAASLKDGAESMAASIERVFVLVNRGRKRT
jgi:hypothetical protein